MPGFIKKTNSKQTRKIKENPLSTNFTRNTNMTLQNLKILGGQAEKN